MIESETWIVCPCPQIWMRLTDAGQCCSYSFGGGVV